MFESDWEALPDIQEWSGDFLMSGSGRETLPNVQEWLGTPLECPGVVRSPSRKLRSGRDALPNICEW